MELTIDESRSIEIWGRDENWNWWKNDRSKEEFGSNEGKLEDFFIERLRGEIKYSGSEFKLELEFNEIFSFEFFWEFEFDNEFEFPLLIGGSDWFSIKID